MILPFSKKLNNLSIKYWIVYLSKIEKNIYQILKSLSIKNWIVSLLSAKLRFFFQKPTKKENKSRKWLSLFHKLTRFHFKLLLETLGEITWVQHPTGFDKSIHTAYWNKESVRNRKKAYVPSQNRDLTPSSRRSKDRL